MQCQMRVYDVFLPCVVERYDVKSQDQCSVLLEKTAFGGNASFSPSRTSNDCLTTSYDTHGSKAPAILRDWEELDAEQAVS